MWTSLRIYIYKIVDFINGLSGLLYRTGWTSVNGILICYALNEEIIIDYIKTCFRERKSLEEQLHKKAMLLSKQYMLMGGLPSYSEKINFFNFSE